MKIGPYDIKEGAFLAPMAGITNPPFRKLCREMGAAFTVTELISSHALCYFAKKPDRRKTGLVAKNLALLEPFDGERPMAVQIFGREPDQMAEAARFVVSQGADIVDLNFGCPARKVVKAGDGAGVALMRDPVLLQEITRRVVDASGVPVTAKIRLGWSGAQKNAPTVAKRLEDEGVAAICVHARTRDQVHSGAVDLDALAATCAAVSIPVIGNGGVRSREDAEQMMERTGCQRVAVGQAAKGNPWIFEQLVGGKGEPGLDERLKTCRRHLALYVEWAGERRAVTEMRKHACWYLKGFSRAAAFRKRLAEANGLDAFSRLLDEVTER